MAYLLTLALHEAALNAKLSNRQVSWSHLEGPLYKVRKLGDNDPFPSPLNLNAQFKKHIHSLFKKKTEMSQKAGIIQCSLG